MTTEQIDKMPEGREMDALIAEKVMGLNVKPVFHPKNELKFMPGFVWRYEDAWEHPEIKDYSTDIAKAWEVVEKLNTHIIIERLEYREDWYCEISGISNSAGEQLHSTTAPTAPLAICRAALKAVIQ
jgi:hypothetical protein